MTAYFFLDVLKVINPEKLETYRKAVLATVSRHGGRYLTVGGKSEVVEGEWHPTFPVLIEFPNLNQARLWYDSEDYRAIKSLRLSATRGNAALIEGKEFAP
jgi:uncharacterized protein (DUF1330 family)